jgi:hypothetical protein
MMIMIFKTVEMIIRHQIHLKMKLFKGSYNTWIKINLNLIDKDKMLKFLLMI